MKYIRHYNIQRVLFIKLCLLCAMVLGFLLYVADPVFVKEQTNNISNEEELMIHFVLDVSLSMYTQENQNTRMHDAISFIRRAIESHSSAKFALSIFTDRLVQLVPFTNETGFLSSTLDSILVEPLLEGSSDITQILSYLNDTSSFQTTAFSRGKVKGKDLIILSDWESHTKVDAQRFSSVEAKYDTILCVLVGSGNARKLRDMQGTTIRDEEGNTVYSSAQALIAEKVAKALNAEYLIAKQLPNLYNVGDTDQQSMSLSWIISFILALLLLGYMVLEH